LALDSIEGLAGVFHRATDDEGHVLTNDYFRFLVIQGQQARRGQDIAGTVALQGVDQQADLGAANGADTTQGGAIGQRGRRGDVPFQESVEARREVEDSAATASKVDDAYARSVIGKAPLHAEFLGAIVGHLGNDRLNQYLGAADIQLADNL